MIVYLLAILFCFVGRFSYPWETQNEIARFFVAFLTCAEAIFDIVFFVSLFIAGWEKTKECINKFKQN